MMTRVKLEAMQFHAYHGVYEDEKRTGAAFGVDVEFVYNASKAVENDQIADALDYSTVYALVKEEMAKPSDLIEHVAGRIVRTIKTTFPDVSDLRVRVSKLKPPIQDFTGIVSVELHS